MPRLGPAGTFAVHSMSPDLIGEWEGLAVATGSIPFARPGWVEAWGEAFGHDLRVATVERSGRLTAVLPIVVDGRSMRTASDWHVPFTEVIASDYEDVITLMQGLDTTFRRIGLDFVLEGSLTELVGATVLAARPTRRITRMRSPYIDTTRDWDQYLETVSTKKLRELRRRHRRLAEQIGSVEYMVIDGAGEWQPAVDEGLRLEASGWKGDAGTAVASDEATERLYRSVLAWAASRKILEVGLLVAGERAVAVDLAVGDGSRTWLLKTGFDHDLGVHAPGQILRLHAIEAAFERGLDSYEFAGETEPWKTEWTDAARAVVRIDAYRRGPLGRAGLLASRVARALRVRGSRLLGRAD